jgi:hypothetical protein
MVRAPKRSGEFVELRDADQLAGQQQPKGAMSGTCEGESTSTAGETEAHFINGGWPCFPHALPAEPPSGVELSADVWDEACHRLHRTNQSQILHAWAAFLLIGVISMMAGEHRTGQLRCGLGGTVLDPRHRLQLHAVRVSGGGRRLGCRRYGRLLPGALAVADGSRAAAAADVSTMLLEESGYRCEARGLVSYALVRPSTEGNQSNPPSDEETVAMS